MRRVLLIRLSSRYKSKVKQFVYDLAQFQNLLRLFVLEWNRKTGDIFKLFNQSLLYSLLADRIQSNKSELQRKELDEVKGIIEQNEELKKWIVLLKEQKKKVRNAFACQHIIIQEVNNLKSWIQLLKEYKRNSERFRGRPGLPKPRKLRDLVKFSVPIRFERKGRRLVLMLRGGDKEHKAERVEVLLPDWFDYQAREVKLIYDMNWIEAQVVYEKELGIECSGSYQAGIDVGLDNLLSVVSDNPELKSFIVSGKELKSFNRWFNKKRAEIQSHVDLVRNMINEEKDEERKKDLEKHYWWLKKYFWNLYKVRDRKLNTWIHQITRRVADLLYETGHRRVYIGKEGIDKNEISLGRVVNQNYVSIPHRKLVNMLKYKCEELGIEVVEVNERYTSKSSPVSDDVVEIQSKRKNGEEVQFSGKRVSRGLYRDLVLGKVFNADLVGAMNILKVGAKLRELMLGVKTLFVKLCNPIRFKLFDLIYKSNPESLLGIGDSMPVFRREALAL